VIRITLRALATRKLRTILTSLAIILGVAMIAGTYVLTDQIDKGFKQIFTDAYKGIDVTVARKTAFTETGGSGGGTVALPQSLVAQVKAVPGVAEAAGYAAGAGAVAVNGKVVSTGGAPTLFFSTAPSDISQTTYVQGSRPTQAGEVAIIRKLAVDKKLTIGSPLTVIGSQGTQTVKVVGVFTFGAESSLGGSLIIDATLADTQKWFGLQGQISEIDVKAQPGTSADTLAQRIKAALPKYADVKTGKQAIADQTKQVSNAIGGFLKPVLLAFGGVAVLVGAFIIFNAFSMTVAQRRREFAMLRALGASRRQVLGVITGEALFLGVLASIAGLFAGVGVSAGVNALFQKLGIDIPHSGIVLATRTIVVALAVGLIVTLLSAVIPAVRATRVPPMAALAEGSQLPTGRYSRWTPWLAGLFALAGVAAIAAGMYAKASTQTRLLQMAFGAVILFVAVAMVARYVVRPVAAVLGWPLQKMSRTSGRLARDNSTRNPSRTAATAAALMIGLAVVVFVAVFAQGLKASFVDTFNKSIKGDYVVSAKNGMALPSDVLGKLQSVPTADAVAGIDGQQVKVNSSKISTVYGVDPLEWGRVWHFDWTHGNDGLLARLGTGNVLVEEQVAKEDNLKIGRSFSLLTESGTTARFTVIGEYRDPMVMNGIVMSVNAYNGLFRTPQLYVAVVKSAPGVPGAQAVSALKQAVADAPTANVQTVKQYKDSVIKQVDQLLNLLYGLLAMSVIISLFGIVNTLVLAVYERTREIGLLRAIGASRRQIRRTVRYESVITSTLGGLLGLVVGIAFAWVITSRFAGQGITFSLPIGQLIVFLVVAVVVGVLAAILPARRAARIDILEAIHYE
jgi:putative ABC transport system permease protein